MQELEDLLVRRKRNQLPVRPTSPDSMAARDRFGSIPADMCVCAAASGTLNAARLDRLESQGIDTIVCGANHPFAAARPGDTALEQEADRRFAVVADFIANCGTAHSVAFQMERDAPARPEEILGSVSEVIDRFLAEAVRRAGSTRHGLLGAAVASALRRVEK